MCGSKPPDRVVCSHKEGLHPKWSQHHFRQVQCSDGVTVLNCDEYSTSSLVPVLQQGHIVAQWLCTSLCRWVSEIMMVSGLAYSTKLAKLAHFSIPARPLAFSTSVLQFLSLGGRGSADWSADVTILLKGSVLIGSGGTLCRLVVCCWHGALRCAVRCRAEDQWWLTWFLQAHSWPLWVTRGGGGGGRWGRGVIHSTYGAARMRARKDAVVSAETTGWGSRFHSDIVRGKGGGWWVGAVIRSTYEAARMRARKATGSGSRFHSDIVRG